MYLLNRLNLVFTCFLFVGVAHGHLDGFMPVNVPPLPAGLNVQKLLIQDLNGDGRGDLVALSESPIQLAVAMANGGPTLFSWCSPISVPGNQALAAYDVSPFTASRDLILLSNHPSQPGVFVLESQFSPPSSCPQFQVRSMGTDHNLPIPAAIAVANINGDRIGNWPLSDLVIGQNNHEIGVALRNRGLTPYLDILAWNALPSGQLAFPQKIAIGDLDDDGYKDIITYGGSNLARGIKISWSNSGLSRLASGPLGRQWTTPDFLPLEHIRYDNFFYDPMSDVLVRDFDGDGDEDLIFARTGGLVTFFMNGQHRGTDGSQPQAFSTWGQNGNYLIGGLDQPGEIAILNRDQSLPMPTVTRLALSSFASLWSTALPFSNIRAFVTGDMNGDGKVEIVFSSRNQLGVFRRQ